MIRPTASMTDAPAECPPNRSEKRTNIAGMNTLFLNHSRPVSLLLALTCYSAFAQVSPKLITGPDQFTFASGGFYCSRGATNALVTVNFIPGDPCWCGQVNYATQDGTAVAGQDYTPVTGTLTFNGTSRQSFAVPIRNNSTSSEQKTITLVLSTNANDSRVILTPRALAVLYINYPPPPALQISPGPNQTMNLSWVDDGTSLVLEKRDTLTSTNWTTVSAWPSSSNGKLTAVDTCAGATALYRLRRPQ